MILDSLYTDGAGLPVPDDDVIPVPERKELPLTVVKPPLNNMAVSSSGVEREKPLYVWSADWVTLTIWRPVQDVKHMLKQAFNIAAWANTGHGSQGFRLLETAGQGISLGSNPTTGPDLAALDIEDFAWDKTYCCLTLTGTGVRTVGLLDLVAFIKQMAVSKIRFNISRCDFAVDTQQVDTADVLRAYEAGRMDTIFRKTPDRRDNRDENGDGGHTVYFGGKKSDVLVRFYRKAIHAHPVFGDETFTRIELQIRGKRALAFFLHVVTADDVRDMARRSVGILASCFQFYKTKTKTSLAGWWDALVNGVDKFWLTIKADEPSLERTWRWLLWGGAASALAACLRAMGVDNLDGMGAMELMTQILLHGDAHMGDTHRKLVEYERDRRLQHARRVRFVVPSMVTNF